jgi:hypothetical protein
MSRFLFDSGVQLPLLPCSHYTQTWQDFWCSFVMRMVWYRTILSDTVSTLQATWKRRYWITRFKITALENCRYDIFLHRYKRKRFKLITSNWTDAMVVLITRAALTQSIHGRFSFRRAAPLAWKEMNFRTSVELLREELCRHRTQLP